jgi:hypothetical protein
MGWSSFSDFIQELTANGKFKLSPFSKLSANASAGVAQRWYEWYTASGLPGPGSLAGAAGTGVQIKQSVQGAGIDIGAAVSPDTRHALLLQAFSPTTTLVPANMFLVDFLEYYPSCVVTGTPTALTDAGLPRYTDGIGVVPIVAVQTAEGAAQPQVLLNCRFDDDSDANLSAALTAPGNSSPISTLHATSGNPFGSFPAGKKGVKRINSYTLPGGTTTGTVALILLKILAQIPIPAISVPGERELLSQIPSPSQIYDDAHLGFIGMPGGAQITAANLCGMLGMGWG